ncbi:MULTISPECIES: hypothetical protein [unclassified Nonomuraea]|uniref:hypothetical protein n=1 Tax=unclassified Nonomuraea TaxID=2593643 RepID=UPI00340C1E71
MPTVRPQIFQATGTTSTVTPPDGAQAGDLLLAFLSTEDAAFGATLTGGTPEWALLTTKLTSNVSGTNTLGRVSSGIWWKPTSTGETSWALAGASQYMGMAVIAITDAMLEPPAFTVSADQASATAFMTVTSPAGPIPAIGDLELRWVGADNYNTSATGSWEEPALTAEVAELRSSYVTAQLTRQNLTSASSPSRSHTVSSGVLAAHGFTLRIRSAGTPRSSVLTPTAAAHRAASW